MKSSRNNQYIKELQAKRIRECMKKYNITSKYIAERLNYSPQHISYVINGKRNLTVEMAMSLANLFSEVSGSGVRNVEMPFSELSESDKEEYADDIYGNGWVNVAFYEPDPIDYRYLLGEIDYMTHFENFDPPTEKTVNYLFKSGISAILHHYGYDLKMDVWPDITLLKNINPYSPLTSDLRKVYNDPKKMSEIVNVETGDTLELLPCELYQLYQDIIKSIVGIVERKFESQQWYDALNTKFDRKKWYASLSPERRKAMEQRDKENQELLDIYEKDPLD